MAGTVIVDGTRGVVTVTDAAGNSVTITVLGKPTRKDQNHATVKIKKTRQQSGKAASSSESDEVVGLTDTGGTASWGFGSGTFVIEVHCPTAAEIEDGKKPTIRMKNESPEVEAEIQLKDEDDQNAKKGELTKMFGPVK